jgi:hypothetical protein
MASDEATCLDELTLTHPVATADDRSQNSLLFGEKNNDSARDLWASPSLGRQTEQSKRNIRDSSAFTHDPGSPGCIFRVCRWSAGVAHQLPLSLCFGCRGPKGGEDLVLRGRTLSEV